MRPNEWIEALNKISATEEMPITLQGGEPTKHEGFYDIVNYINKPMDLLTNLQFDVDEFMKYVSPEKFKRNAPYPAIRVSYHPQQMSLQNTMGKLMMLKMNGYQVGIYTIDHPDYEGQNYKLKLACEVLEIKCKSKPLLGMYKGKLHGVYKYEGAVNSKRKECMCKPSELIIAPDGNIHHCHYSLYSNSISGKNILSHDFEPTNEFLHCINYGKCNPCDIKITTNRLQVFGHTSVEIKDVT